MNNYTYAISKDDYFRNILYEAVYLLDLGNHNVMFNYDKVALVVVESISDFTVHGFVLKHHVKSCQAPTEDFKLITGT
jgi:hypothetical protein